MNRLRNHRQLAKKFLQTAERLPAPDVIVSSLPTLDFCSAAIDFGRRYSIPVVLDVRDLWPDIFVNLTPSLLRRPARQLLSPFYRQVESACANATSLTGITDAFVEWGVEKAARPRRKLDRAFPMGYAQSKPSSDEIDEAFAFWRSHGVARESGEFIVCFFGTLGRHFEASTVMRAAKKLSRAGRPIRIVICGTGEKSKEWHRLAKQLPNVTMPGWVNAAQIWTLMRMSSAALAPYVSTHDFSRSLPNKSIEYLSAGLPVVSSLRGVLAELLLQHDSGITYENGNSEQLADAILQLQNNPQRCQTISANATALFRKKFVAEEIYDSMADHLEQVACEKPSLAHAA